MFRPGFLKSWAKPKPPTRLGLARLRPKPRLFTEKAFFFRIAGKVLSVLQFS
jgi:hypothetical protein